MALLRSLFALAWLATAATACNRAESIDRCPPGSVQVGTRCLVSCSGPSDCLSGEMCDPVIGACRSGLEPDASISGDAATEGDSGVIEGPDSGEDRPDAGMPRDAGPPSDSGATDAGEPVRDAGFREDAEPHPDASNPDAQPPGVDGGFSLRVTSNRNNFDWPMGCPPDVPAEIELENDGAGPILLQSALLVPSSPEWSLDASQLPPQLLPGQSAFVFVTHAPMDVGANQTTVVVQHTPSMTPAQLSLSGRGLAREMTDVFTQVVDQADIVIVIDDSCSMTDKQAEFSQNVGPMLNALQNRVDFRIGVTTTDMDTGGARGAFVGTPRILTPQTPNLEQVLTQRILIGNTGSGTEQGLAAGHAAITPPLSTGTNSGFLRPNASLVIAVLTDEEDYSPQAVADYVAGIEGAKGNGRAGSIALNAVAAFTGGSCPGVVSVGTRYINAALQTGGISRDLCQPQTWLDVLTTLPPSNIPRTDQFTLSEPAEASSIQVLIDGQAAPRNTWAYDGATRRVLFPNDPPPHGSEIRISYLRACL